MRPANPWRAQTLEWQVSSPPPIFNFDGFPTVVGGPYEYGVPGAVHGIFKSPTEAAKRSRPEQSHAAEPGEPRVSTGRPRRRQRDARRPRAGRRRAQRVAEGDVRFVLVVPQNRPKAGLVIYDDAVFDAAQARVDLALALRPRRGDRGDRRGRGSRSLHGDDGRRPRVPARRDHHLHLSGDPLGLAAARPDRARARGRRRCPSSTSSPTPTPRGCRSTSRWRWPTGPPAATSCSRR